MASFVYTNAKRALLAGELDLDSHDIRVLLVMTGTQADTNQDAATITALGTLDEYGGTNYVRKALASEAVAADDANNRGEFDAADVTWTELGAGATNCIAAVIYRYVDGTAGNDIPIAYIEWAAPWNGNGGDVTIQWNVEGILQAT